MAAKRYASPITTFQITAPAERVCHPKKRWTTPANSSSHATTMLIAMPAIKGREIAARPAKMRRIAITIAMPLDLWAGCAGTEVAMRPPRTSGRQTTRRLEALQATIFRLCCECTLEQVRQHLIGDQRSHIRKPAHVAELDDWPAQAVGLAPHHGER